MAGWLSTLRGQATAIETIHRAVSGGRVHHAYLFEGPDGVGKERAAFGLAQALVCERRKVGERDACGECHPCQRAVPRPPETRAIHPDVVVLERGLYDPATIGRRTPEAQDISIDQVRTLVLARSAFAPHEGRAKVFIVRRAEELSVSAANALLKTLEEPGARTHFVLLSEASDLLLPTILSRTQRVRFGPLPEATITALLVERGFAKDVAETVSPLAGGSMSAALVLSDPEAKRERDAFVSQALGALKAPSLGPSLELAEECKKMGKDVLVARLGVLAAALAAEGRATVLSEGRDADVAALRHGLVLATVRDLDGNAAVQLALESLFIKMRSL